MNTIFKRSLSMLLAVLMVVSYVPTSAFATENAGEVVHDHSTPIVVQDPSCTDGYATYACGCTDVIPGNGHSYEETVTKEATCTEAGEATFTCSVCGDSYTEEIVSNGHSYTESVTKEATCTEAGEATFTCSVCGDSYTEEIASNGHSYAESVTKEATCTEAGEATFTCSVCGDSYTEDIPVIEHDYVDHVCTVCGNKEALMTSVAPVTVETTSDGLSEDGTGATFRAAIFKNNVFSQPFKSGYGKDLGEFLAYYSDAENTEVRKISVTLLENIILDEPLNLYGKNTEWEFSAMMVDQNYTPAMIHIEVPEDVSARTSVFDAKNVSIRPYVTIQENSRAIARSLDIQCQVNLAPDAMLNGSSLYVLPGGMLLANGTVNTRNLYFYKGGDGENIPRVTVFGKLNAGAVTMPDGGNLTVMTQNNAAVAKVENDVLITKGELIITPNSTLEAKNIKLSGPSKVMVKGSVKADSVTIGKFTNFAGDIQQSDAPFTVNGNCEVGTFTLMDTSACVIGPEGLNVLPADGSYEVVFDEQKTLYTLQEKAGVEEQSPVAYIGETPYYDLQEAVNAGGEIVMHDHVVLEDTLVIPAGKTVVLDLGGYTISQEKACTGNYSMILNKGNLTITGIGTISFNDTGAGDPNFGWGSYTLRNEGTLVIENTDITIEHLGQQNVGGVKHMYCAIFQYSGSSTIKGGTISTPTYRSVRLWKGDMDIQGGNFQGQVWVQAVDNSAKLTISGNTACFQPMGVDGSSVYVENSQYEVAFSVTGGSFNTKIGCADAAKLAGSVSGGQFTQAAKEGTNAALIKTGYVLSPDGEEGYAVVPFKPIQSEQDTTTKLDVEDVEVTGEVEKTVVDNAKAEIADNTAVQQVTGLTENTVNVAAAQEASEKLIAELVESGKIEKNEDIASVEPVMSIQVTGITGEGEAVTKLSFDVKPQVKVTVVSGENTASFTKKIDTAAEITFNLPLPKGFAKFVNVYHNGVLITEQPVSVMEGANGNYVTVKASSFSPFDVEKAEVTEPVAKVGNTEYTSIDEAIAAWTNGTTLTLLSDVTLSDVIKLSSTEYHILDLGTYTMTAASRKDAIQIVNNGRSSASYTLDIKADADNPGGITASGKTIVATTGKSGVKDRPIIRFYNGVFNASYVVKHSGSNGTNCPQFQFHGGVFNGGISTNRSLNQFYGGVFTGSLFMSVDSSAYTLVAGGTFKQLSNLYNSTLNSDKFTIGSAKGVYDKEVYIDDNGNYVIAAAEPSEGIEAGVAKTPGTNDYLAYSKVATEGQLKYTDVYTALEKNNTTSAKITVYVDEVDMSDISYKGTIVVPDGSITIINAPATLKVYNADGEELISAAGADGKTVYSAPAAKIGTTDFATLAAAAEAAVSGDEIILLSDVTEDVTLPAGVTFNGNGKAVGIITAAGEVTFKGHTKAANFGVQYVNTTINIGEGACLEITGGSRLVIGHGCTFNIIGTITDAKTADKANVKPSLIMPGASFTGAGVTFNVKNAYIKAPSSYCSSSKSASGTFDFNIENSIWESADKLAFESQSTAATVNFNLKNSVLTTGSHLVFGVSRGEVVIDNSNVNVGTSRQIENQSTMTIKNGSVVNGAVATSSNAKNPGTLTVDNATYAVTGEFSGSNLGTGTLIIKNGAIFSAGSITKADIEIDATGMNAGDVIDITADLSKHAGTMKVTGNDELVAKVVDGKVVLAERTLSGTGTQADPYLISDLIDLKLFAKMANAGNTFAGKYVKLTADIDLKSEEWTPIGYMGKTFKGNFDGGNHTISNLKITKTLTNSAANNDLGLFGRTDDPAVIQNLIIENVDITGSLHVGAVVGHGYTGKAVQNVTVKGDITIDAWWYAGVIGGYGYMNEVKNCHVIGNDGSYVKGNSGSYIGGIWGFRGEGANKITNCSVTKVDIIGVDRVGGICGIGHYGNEISGCSATGVTVTATDPEATTVGLIVGACQGTTDEPTVFTGNTLTDTTARIDNGDGTYTAVTNLYGTTIGGTEAVTNFAAEVNGVKYETLAEAITAANGGTVYVLQDVEESITEIENVKLSTNVAEGVTITNTYGADYVDFNNVTLGSGITLNIPYVFSSGSENVIEGALNVSSTYYNAYNAKTTVQNGGKVTTVGMTVNRYHTDPEAGIYIYGDGNTETVEWSCANTIGAYTGTFYAKDAVIEANQMWLDDKNGGEDSYETVIDAVFENCILNVTKDLRLSKDAHLTLNGSDVTAGEIQIRTDATPVVNVENSTVKATTVLNQAGVSVNAVLGADGTVTFETILGSGTEADPFMIDNAEELFLFAERVNSGYAAYKGAYFQLSDDIDLEQEDWTSIGTPSNPFTGTFDGNDKTISNLWSYDRGLFGYTSTGNYVDSGVNGRATIKNLTVNNATVINQNTSAVGGIVGQANQNTVLDNVKLTGEIQIFGYGYVGGIVGQGYVHVNNCHVDGVNAENSEINASFWAVAGIVGHAGSEGGASITNCSVKNVTIYSQYYGAGSIAGVGTTGTIDNISAESVKIDAQSTPNANGYLVGTNYGAITGDQSYVKDMELKVAGEIVEVPQDIAASIDGALYVTLQAAINAAAKGDIITLVNDKTMAAPAVVAADDEIVLDLNGHKIVTTNGNGIQNKGTLTIQGEGEISGSSYGVNNSGTLTVTSGKIGAIYNSGSLTVNGGTVANTISGKHGIYHSGTKLLINGGEFTTTSGNELIFAASSGVAINGGTFTQIGKAYLLGPANAAIEINGGTFYGYVNENGSNDQMRPGAAVISGGLFNFDVANWCAEDYKSISASDGLYGVMMADSVYLYTGSRPKKFDSLHEALAYLDELGKTNPDAANNAQIELLTTIYEGDLKINYDVQIVGTFACEKMSAASIYVAPGKTLTLNSLKIPETKIYSKDVTSEAKVNGQEIKGIETQPAHVTSDGNTVKLTNPAWAAKIGSKYYMTIADAVEAANAGETVTILPGEYNEKLNVNKAITVIGDDEGEVKLTDVPTFKGNGYTVQNIDFVYSSGYNNLGGSGVIEDCTFTATTNAFGSCYGSKNGNITFENCELKASTYAVHFDEAYGTDLTFTDCEINGRVALGADLGSLTATETDFKNGYVNVWGTEDAATFTGCDFVNVPYVFTGYDADNTVNFNTCKVDGAAMNTENVSGLIWRSIESTNTEIKLDGKLVTGVAKIGDTFYSTLAAALTAAQNGETVTLVWATGKDPIAMNGAVFGKTVTITGTATVDWSKGFLFVGRGGAGDGTLIFDDANLTSASGSSNSGYGIHVSGREKDTADKYNGTLKINNSTIDLDFLINKGNIALDNATLTVKNGFSNGGRPANETESGEDATATLTLNNGSKLIVNDHNGMGLGYEAIGILNVNSGSTFETTQSFLITDKGTLNVNGGNVKTAGTLTNNGVVYVTGASDIAGTFTGEGWVYMDGVTLSAATKLSGAKVGFINGTNEVVGSTIENGWFNVGIGKDAEAAKANTFAVAKGITLGNVTVNVSDDAVISPSGATYSGWVGSAYSAVKTQNKYTLNIKNSQAAFGYIHVSKDGVLNVKGHATNKYTHDNANVDFYAGDLIVNGVVTMDGTDAWVKYTKMSADYADGVLNIVNGTNYESSVHNGSNTKESLIFYKAAEINVDKTSAMEIDNVTTLTDGAELNVAGAVTAKGAVNGNGTITLTVENATYTAAENLTVKSALKDWKVKYEDGVYKLISKVYVAKIGDEQYESLADAVKAVQDGQTIELYAAEFSEGTIKLPAALKNVTFKGVKGGTVLKDMTIMAADGNSIDYQGLTFDGITFDNSNITITGWRNGTEIVKDLIITNCTFENIVRTGNVAAVHLNADPADEVDGFTFTNNVINGVSGSSNSGIYCTGMGGNILVENNTFNNVALRPFILTIQNNDSTADTITITGNTFSGSSVGRLQVLGTNSAGTDKVNLNTTNNIIKDITNDFQICYWNFNPETTKVDLSKNYYDIDIQANPGKIYFNGAATNAADLIEKGVYPYYADEDMTEQVEAPAIMVTYPVGNPVYPDGKIEYYNDMLEAVPYTTNCPRLEGATITLLKDTSGAGMRFMENDMVFDLNGHTYTITAGTGSQGTNTSGFQIRPEVTTDVIFKNGTIKVAEGAPVVWMFNNYATDFIVENVTVDCANMAWSYGESCYVHVSRPGDNTQFTGNTKIENFNAAVAGNAINVGGTMTIGENVVPGGTIELDAGATLTAPAGLDVVTVDGYDVTYENGVYTSIQIVAKIGDANYYTFETAVAAAQAGDEVKILKSGTYSVPTGKSITITGAVDGVEFTNIGEMNMGGANVTFNNVTFTYADDSSYKGLQYAGDMVYNNCTFNGQVFLYGTSETFNKCTFNQTSSNAYNVWTYSAKEVKFNECTFNSAGKSVLIYHEGKDMFNDVTVTKSTFNASTAVADKAAIEMDSQYTAGINLTIDSATTATGFGNETLSGNSLWNNKKGNEGVNNDITVTVNNKIVLEPIKTAELNGVVYTTLPAAMAVVKEGETIKLLSDVTLDDLIKIEKAITIDLGGKKVTTNAKKAFEIYADATIMNGTIEAANRCVDTRKAVELTLTDVKLIANEYTTYGNPQPLTIGGSENGTKVTMTNVNISAKAGYGIITFVKTDLTATDSTIGGYNALYVKPGSEDSTFKFVNTDLSGSTGNNDVAGNSFSTIVVCADNVTVNVDVDSSVTATGNYCCAISLGGANEENVTGAEVIVNGTIEGNVLDAASLNDNTVTIQAKYADALGKDGYAHIVNNDGTITAAVAAAKIGETCFTSLKAAYAEASEGAVIELVRNSDLTDLVLANKAVNIKRNGFVAYIAALEGYMVRAEKDYYYITKNGEVIVEDEGAALAYVEDENVGYNGEELYTLNQALKLAANNGGVVKLKGDLVGENAPTTVLIPAGVTLYLDSFTLEADYVIGLNGSKLGANTDTTKNDGKLEGGVLKVAKENVSLSAAPYMSGQYSVLPVWNKDHYVFSLFYNYARGSKQGLFVYEDEKRIYVQYKHQATNDVNIQLMGDNGVADNAVSILLRFEWEANTGKVYQDFVFKDEYVKNVAIPPVNVDDNLDYYLSIVNYDKQGIVLDSLKVTPMIIAECGAECAGVTWTIQDAKK